MSGSPDSRFICLGIVASAIGVRGEVRIKTFTETPVGLADYGTLRAEPSGRMLEIQAIRDVRGGAGVFLKGIADRNAAEALKGLELGVDRDDLGDTEDEETFFHVDLIGLDVKDKDGNILGDVKAVHDFGGGDVLELNLTAETKTELVRFNKQNVPVVDIEGGFLVIHDVVMLAGGDEKKEGDGE